MACARIACCAWAASSSVAQAAGAATPDVMEPAAAPSTELPPERAGRQTDFITLRYYGRFADRFEHVRQFPREVCTSFPARCVDVALNECLESPASFKAPHWRMRDGRASVLSESGSGLGSYILLTRIEGQDLTLWTGCELGCKSCMAGGGPRLAPLELPSMCTETIEGGVFGSLYNDNSGAMDTHHNCVASLEDHWAEVDRRNASGALVRYLVIGGVALLMSAVVLVIWWHWCCLKRRHGATVNQTGQGYSRQAGVPMPLAIGRTDIDRDMPETFVSDLPQCVVCLLPVEPAQPCRTLNCGHSFHSECIIGWWLHTPRSQVDCPMCKRRQSIRATPPPPLDVVFVVEARPSERTRGASSAAAGAGEPTPVLPIPSSGDPPRQPGAASDAAAAAAAGQVTPSDDHPPWAPPRPSSRPTPQMSGRPAGFVVDPVSLV